MPNYLALTHQRIRCKILFSVRSVVKVRYLSYICVQTPVCVVVFEIWQKIPSLKTWQQGTLCGLACTGKNSGLMEAPLCFDAGPTSSLTLVLMNVWPCHLMTQDGGQMIHAHSRSHSSVTNQVMLINHASYVTSVWVNIAILTIWSHLSYIVPFFS